jgi:hypothetical protein
MSLSRTASFGVGLGPTLHRYQYMQVYLRDDHVLAWNPKLIEGTDVQYIPHEIEVRDIAVWRDRPIAVGHFSEAGIPGNPDDEGNNRLGHVAIFDLVSGAPMPWESKPEYPVFSVAANTNHVYWSGAGKGTPRSDVAQLDPMIGRMLERYATDGNQQSVHATDDWLFIGGHHDNIVPDVYASAGSEESLAVRHGLMTFAFGDAVFHGSTGDIRLAQPIVGMTGR